MDEKVAVLEEKIRELSIRGDARSIQIEKLGMFISNLDKSLAILENGLSSVKDWLKELEETVEETQKDNVSASRFWLSFLLSLGAIAIAIINLLLR